MENTPLLKFIEVESNTKTWSGRIFLRVQRENKVQYVTKSYPSLGIVASNYKDRSNQEVRWHKKTLFNSNCVVKKIWDKIPTSDDSKIFD